MTYRGNQIPLSHPQMDALADLPPTKESVHVLVGIILEMLAEISDAEERPEPRVEKHDNGSLPHETPPPPSFKQRRRKKPKKPNRSKK